MLTDTKEFLKMCGDSFMLTDTKEFLKMYYSVYRVMLFISFTV